MGNILMPREAIYDLVEAMYVKDYSTYAAGAKFFKDLKIAKIKEGSIREAYDKCITLVKYYKENVPDFDDLKAFADFVFAMEKSFFYNNDKETSKVFGTVNNNTSTLIFNVTGADVSIKIDLYYEGSNEVTDLFVTRNFGRKMKNHHHIINREMPEDTDGNETIMIGTINRIIQNYMSEFLQLYADKVYNGYVYDFDGNKYSNDRRNRYQIIEEWQDDE